MCCWFQTIQLETSLEEGKVSVSAKMLKVNKQTNKDGRQQQIWEEEAGLVANVTAETTTMYSPACRFGHTPSYCWWEVFSLFVCSERRTNISSKLFRAWGNQDSAALPAHFVKTANYKEEEKYFLDGSLLNKGGGSDTLEKLPNNSVFFFWEAPLAILAPPSSISRTRDTSRDA